MSIADELAKLETLRSSGAINDEEFAQAKALVLKGLPSTASLSGAGLSSPPSPANPLRRFARSSRDKWLGGVCGGLGVHTEIPSWACASVSACCFCHLASDWCLTSFFGSLCRKTTVPADRATSCRTLHRRNFNPPLASHRPE